MVANFFAAALHFVLKLFIVLVMFRDGESVLRFVFATCPLPNDEERLLATGLSPRSVVVLVPVMLVAGPLFGAL